MEKSTGGPRSGDPTIAEAAAYVADLSAELATIARLHGLNSLGFILDMAQMEARNATRHADGQH